MPQPTSYLRLNELNTSSENLILQSPDGSDDVHPTASGVIRKQLWGSRLLWLANGLVFCSALAVLVYSVISFPTNIQCGRQLSTYSPALDGIEYVDIRFNGTLTAPSIYRGDPGTGLDNAWFSVSRDPRPVRITESTVFQAGKSNRSSTVRYREEDGGGYKATIEYTHQLHCLNVLRKVFYRDYYEKHEDTHFFEGKPETVNTHIDHCIEMLRQVFMCNADTGIITYEWVDGFHDPHPNFNTMHRCRNFDKLQSWNLGHSSRVPVTHVTPFADTVDLLSAP